MKVKDIKELTSAEIQLISKEQYRINKHDNWKYSESEVKEIQSIDYKLYLLIDESYSIDCSIEWLGERIDFDPRVITLAEVLENQWNIILTEEQEEDLFKYGKAIIKWRNQPLKLYSDNNESYYLTW